MADKKGNPFSVGPRGGGRPSAPDKSTSSKPGPISFIPRGSGTASKIPQSKQSITAPGYFYGTKIRPTSTTAPGYFYGTRYTPTATETRNTTSGGGGRGTGGGSGNSGGDAVILPATVQNPINTNSPAVNEVVDGSVIGSTTSPVKLPSRDVVNLIEPGLDVNTITNLLFENIGATELTKFTRHDTVDGINPYYNIISNLSDIKRKYDPSSLISLQKPESSYFDIYSIKLDQRLPDQTYLDQNNLTDYIYIDTNGDLVIELVNLASDEIIEVEIDTSGTIYEVDEL